MIKDEILAALPKLPKGDLMAIQAVLNHLLGGPTGPLNAGGTVIAPVMFEALARALPLAISPLNVPSQTMRLYNERAAQIVLWLNENFTDWNTKKVTELAFLTSLFDLLIKDLRKNKITPTLGVVITHMIRIPKVFDDAFPGYIKSRMGNLVLKHFQ